MLLRLGSGEEIVDPTQEDLRTVLASFDGGETAFLILEEDPMTRNFMQATGDGQTFYLEFAEAGEPVQWGTRDKDVSFETACHLLMLYRRGDESYKTLVKWEVQEYKSGCSMVLLIVLCAAAWWLLA